MLQDTYLIDDTPGSLSNIYKIKILICCVINETKNPFTKYQLNDVFQYNGTVNYFNFCQAIKELFNTKHIFEKSNTKGDASYLYLTNLGRETAITLKNNVPKSAIDRTLNGLKTLITKDRQNKGRQVTIIKKDDGYIVKLVLEETGSNLIDLDLFCPNEELAKKMKKEMEAKTTDVYRCILAILSNDHKTLFKTAANIKSFLSLNQ